MSLIEVEKKFEDKVWVIGINRPEVRNCVDGPTGTMLAKKLVEFDLDPVARVAVVHGKGGCFCSGADLQSVGGTADTSNNLPIEPVVDIGVPVQGTREGWTNELEKDIQWKEVVLDDEKWI
eukprot:TRINITY_DN5639_c0_g1_i4.p1 TRINITY_DN5639_c0_g1~~TRINITY_DN5639_c0_g1_i4.p1  ORF type:complete len:121 (+),score=33.49 TRINITY_DN5639_c0_g1_i4:632-994(+)